LKPENRAGHLPLQGNRSALDFSGIRFEKSKKTLLLHSQIKTEGYEEDISAVQA
jgi:hypothetical protein